MSDEAYDASLDLLRRLDPKNIDGHLTNICRIAPDLAEDLLSAVDTSLQVGTCGCCGREYLLCDYNRDGDSYRSPYSNKYYPSDAAADDAPFPSERLRKMEVFANDSFNIYRELYYEGGISSVYLWDQDEDEETGGFAGVVLLKKKSDDGNGVWDSIHVVEVAMDSKTSATYKLTSTIILSLDSASSDVDSLSLSGNLTRQTERKLAVVDDVSHVSNIGQLVEEVETKLRNMLQEVYFGKTRDILGDLRTTTKLSLSKEDRERQSEVVKGLGEL